MSESIVKVDGMFCCLYREGERERAKDITENVNELIDQHILFTFRVGSHRNENQTRFLTLSLLISSHMHTEMEITHRSTRLRIVKLTLQGIRTGATVAPKLKTRRTLIMTTNHDRKQVKQLDY